MKSKFTLFLLLVVLVALGVGWYLDRQWTAKQWRDAYLKQVEEITELHQKYLDDWQANQAWPPTESYSTSALKYNGSTRAGTVRIDRYLCGPGDSMRIDFILDPKGTLRVQCRNRQ